MNHEARPEQGPVDVIARPRWRLLEDGEQMMYDDECLAEDAETWNKVGWLFSKCRYNKGLFLPARRKVA